MGKVLQEPQNSSVNEMNYYLPQAIPTNSHIYGNIDMMFIKMKLLTIPVFVNELQGLFVEEGRISELAQKILVLAAFPVCIAKK